MIREDLEYVGFFARVGASIIDGVLLLVISLPVLFVIYGDDYLYSTEVIQGPADFFINYVLPPFIVISFWAAKQATPGKMAVRAKIVDAQTGNACGLGQLIGRYLGYIISMLPLGLGLLWVAFDDKKQGFHDKLAGTVVVRKKERKPKAVSFD
ncbi:RDD family protein [Alteromonas sp. ASW11-36]|uniref:RDD family protein n=1 Tax=Alteromonas arenosi TaxID=3055817 RepID=A0ABT7SXD3_9ALTE|nr:RDD family protein [Alteromonas sp. ASW11-36]MDM7860848.1 RDD family protein [Alteromonas sp. ASW11-36]